MREIKFRGKRTDNGKWAYGFYCFNDYKYHTVALFKVLPETIGQYTGLKDKNGKEIYEGDIVKRKGVMGIVVFHDSEFALKMDGYEYVQHGLLTNAWKNDIEVIGNIHDNPGLIGE